MVGAVAVSGGLRVAVRRCRHQLHHRAGISVTRVACLAQGFEKEILKEGTGAQPAKGQKVRSWLRHAA